MCANWPIKKSCVWNCAAKQAWLALCPESNRLGRIFLRTEQSVRFVFSLLLVTFCVCVCGFALGRDLLQLGPKIDGENLSLSTPCLRHWTNWTFINRANKQRWLSKHKHTYVRETERERERELERQSALATKSFLLVIFFLVGFRVCSTLRQFKINWFPCLAGCAGP